jgi:hypothetical protein
MIPMYHATLNHLLTKNNFPSGHYIYVKHVIKLITLSWTLPMKLFLHEGRFPSIIKFMTIGYFSESSFHVYDE